MATPAPFNSAEAVAPTMTTAAKLIKAFDELATKNAGLIVRVQETFDERARIPGLDEGRGGTRGLSAVLAGLLTILPPESSCCVGVTGPESAAANESFKQSFRKAVEDVEHEYPLALSSLEKHAKEDGRPFVDFLASLLEFYASDKVGYPY